MATNRDLAMVNAAISQQNTMAKRIAKMQTGAMYANNTAESLLKGAMRGGYITKDAYNQAVANIGNQTAQQAVPTTTQSAQQTGGVTADSLMQGYQQWLNQQGQQDTQQNLSSGGAAGTGYQQFLQQSGQNQQTIPSLMDSVKNMTNEDLAKQINIANMVKNQTAQTQDEQNKNVADILAKLNNDSSMADQARQLLNQRNIDYTNQTGKTDYDDAVQRTLQAAIPSLADNQAATTANAQNGAQTAAQTYSNEDIAKIMADAGGGDANALLQQLNSNPELAQQAQAMLAQRDQDYAKLQSQQTGQNSQTYTNEQIAQAISQASGRDTNEVLQQLNNNPTLVQQAQQLLTQRDRDYASLKKSETDSVAVAQSVNQPTAANTKQVSKAKSAYRQAQSATQTAKKQLDAAQKKLDQRDKKLQSLQNSLAKAKAAAKKSGHYEQVNAIQQQIRGMQDTSADNKAFQKATDAYNKARRNEQAARLKWANQAIENPVAKNGNELKVTAKPDEDQTLATAQNLVTAAQNGKLTKDQKSEAKTIADYYAGKIRKATLNGQSVSDDEMNAYTALKNATSAGASFMSGLADAFSTTKKVAQGVGNAIGKLTGEDNAGDQLKQQLQTTQQATKNQHGVANVAGTMAGKGAQYAMFNQLAGAAGVTPAIENTLNSKLGLNAANVASTAKGVAGKKLTEQLADVIVGQAADTAFDTIPTIMDNVAAGKYNGNTKQLANDVADNQMNNLAMNMGMNTLQSGVIPSIADAIKNVLGKGKTAEDAVSNIAKNAAYTNDSNRAPLNYQSSEDAQQEAQRMLADELARQKTAVQSPEDADKEAADLLRQYTNDTHNKENVQRGVNSFVDKAKSVQYPDEQAGSIVSAAKQNQWEAGMKNLERDVNNIATQNDRPIEEGVTSLSNIKNTIDKMKQVRPDLSDDLDDIARRIAPENSDYLTGSVSDTAEQTAREYGNIYEGVGKSDSKATSQYKLGEYKGKAIDPDMSIASLQKNISKFEDKYGADDKTVQTLLNKAKRAVNDIDDAVGNGKVGVAEDALDSYQSAQNVAEEEINPSDAVSRMEERMDKRTSKTDDEGYIGRGYTNTIKNSKLATDEQYMKGLDEQTKHFTVSEKESFENGKAAYNRDPEAFVKKYSASMEKDQLRNIGSSDIDAMHIAYGKLNQAAKDATDPVEAESLRRQASNIARNLTDAQHYNAQTLQANAKWRGTSDGAIMSADGTVQRMIDESLTPRQHNQIDDASQKISEMLKNMLDGKMETTADNQLAWQEVKKALDGYSQLKGKFTDKQIQNLTDSVLKNKDWNGVQNLLKMKMTGYSGISTDAIDKATNLFDEAQKYNYGSRKYMDLEEEAYKVLAKDIQSQPGFKGASFGQKVDSIRYLMMLGNPKTMIKNEAGNWLWGKVTGIKDNVAAVIEKAADRAIKANGDLRTKTVLNPLSENDKSLISAAREYGEENAARALSGNKYTNPSVSLERSISTFGNDPFGRLAQGLSDKVSDILDNADQRAMMDKYQDALARFVKANGKDVSIFSDGSQEAKDFLEQASDYAVHQAEEAAFHQSDDFSNYLSKMINGLKGSNQKLARGVGTVADAVIPFKKTPANVLRSCWEYSPLEYTSAFLETMKLVRGEISSTKYIDDIAKATTGTGMYVLGGLLANWGIIRIGSNKGTKEQNTDTRTGVQNGALYIGNHSIDLSDLAPAAYPLIAGATFQESFKNEKDFWTALTNALTSSASSLIDTTMLMGINDILESVKYGDRSESGIASVGKSVAESYVGQFLPTAGRAFNSTVDDTQRSTYSSKTGVGKEVESTAKYLETKIPGLQQVGEWADKKNIPVLKNLKLQPAIDAWGNEKKQNSVGVNVYTDNKAANFAGRAVANFLTPAKASADASLPIDNKIRELKERLVSNGEMSAEDADDLFPYTPQSEAKIDGTKLSESDWTQYQKDKGSLSKDLAEELLTSGKYDDLSDTDKAEILQKCYKFAKTNTAKDYGGNVSSENQKLLDAYTSGGVSGVIDTMISKNEKSSFESAVRNSNSDGKATIDNVVDYLNALDKQDSSKAKELAKQASEYQKGDYTKENGQWVYKNNNTTKTGTGEKVTIPGPDDVGLPKATTSTNENTTSTQTTSQPSWASKDTSEYTKLHAEEWAKYSPTSTVGESGEDYSSSARYQRVSQLKNVSGVETNGVGYEKAYKQIDSDGNGSLKKSEITSWIDNMAAQNGWDQKTKRSVYAAFAPKNYKNPY